MPRAPGCPCFQQNTTLDYNPLGVPGAFGMLNLNKVSGTPGSSTEANWILHGYSQYLGLGSYPSDPGAKFSSGGNVVNALQDRIGTVLLFPVSDTLTGNRPERAVQHRRLGRLLPDRLRHPRQHRIADRPLHAVHRERRPELPGFERAGLRRSDDPVSPMTTH